MDARPSSHDDALTPNVIGLLIGLQSSDMDSSSSSEAPSVLTPNDPDTPAIALASPTVIADDAYIGAPESYDDVVWPVRDIAGAL